MRKYVIALFMGSLFLMMCTSHVETENYYMVDKQEKEGVQFDSSEDNNTKELDSSITKAPTLKIHRKNYQDFKKDLAISESSNTLDTINQFGYRGKYQFGGLALQDVGVKDTSKFLKDSIKQDIALKRLLSINSYRLRKYLPKESDTIWIHGVATTRSGLLAGAHLVGAGAVKKWIKKGEVAKDGNDITMISYIKKFNGYTMHGIKPTKYFKNGI